MEELALAVLSALAGSGVGALAARRFFPVEVEVPVIATHASLPGLTVSPDVPHEHEYDHISGAGKHAGRWRCGVCDQAKPEEVTAS